MVLELRFAHNLHIDRSGRWCRFRGLLRRYKHVAVGADGGRQYAGFSSGVDMEMITTRCRCWSLVHCIFATGCAAGRQYVGTSSELCFETLRRGHDV